MRKNLKKISILLIVFFAISLFTLNYFSKSTTPIKLKKEVFVYEYKSQISNLSPSQFLIADDDILSNTVLYFDEKNENPELTIIYDNSGSVIAIDNLQIGEYNFIAKYENIKLKFIIKII